MERAYNKYAVDVVNGKIKCCESIKLACKRYLSDLERADLIFREGVVDRAIDFIGTLKHFTSKASGKPFVLEPW